MSTSSLASTLSWATVAALPLIQARLRPSVSTVRRSSRLSSSGKPCSSSQLARWGGASNSAAISQRDAPSRTTPLSERAPRASCSASIRMDLPAPVSPVSTQKPWSSSRSSDCTMTKSRKTMRRRLMNVGRGGTCEGQTGRILTGISTAFVPVQFFAQGVEIAPADRVQQTQGVLGAPHHNPVAVQQAGEGLHVEVGAGVAARDDLNRDLAVSGQYDGAVRSEE